MDLVMEKATRPQEAQKPSPRASAGGARQSIGAAADGSASHQIQSPVSITRSDQTNPYPTTFVQADTSNFKQVVQMLTGSSSEPTKPAENPSPNPKGGGFVIPPKKQSSFKLYERRQNNSLKNSLMINTLRTNSPLNSPRSEILSPSLLDFPKLALSSPVTPLSNVSSSSSSEEERAIAEKGFYLHQPSPISTPRDSEPRLLPLFPVESPRFSSESST